MDREEAKIWASIPRKKLEVIASHLDKHFDLLCAYANGAEIQLKFRDERDWHTLNSPDFNADGWAEYRVKPSAEQHAKPWRPKIRDIYYCIDMQGEIMGDRWEGVEFEESILYMGNCFQTHKEAEEGRERMRAALKGEAVSVLEKVESLDGKPLTDNEKTLLRHLRKIRIVNVFYGKIGTTVLLDSETNNACFAEALNCIKEEHETQKPD